MEVFNFEEQPPTPDPYRKEHQLQEHRLPPAINGKGASDKNISFKKSLSNKLLTGIKENKQPVGDKNPNHLCEVKSIYRGSITEGKPLRKINILDNDSPLGESLASIPISKNSFHINDSEKNAKKNTRNKGNQLYIFLNCYILY